MLNLSCRSIGAGYGSIVELQIGLYYGYRWIMFVCKALISIIIEQTRKHAFVSLHKVYSNIFFINKEILSTGVHSQRSPV